MADTRIDDTQRLFGQALVASGMATRQEVAWGLKEQGRLAVRGVFRNLGEILVARGVITAMQVRRLLAQQDKIIMGCPRCREQYNILREWKGQAHCPSDGTMLAEAGEDAGVGVVATLDTGKHESPAGMEIGGCRLISLLGRGATGSVYKARHLGLNRYVAVKLMPSLEGDPHLMKRILHEARAVAKLEHPNIIQVYDVGSQGGYLFIVMQLLQGRTLEDRLAQAGAMAVPAALAVARDVARALGVVHKKGIVHRDLKPANIFLSADGTARLTDFGLAQDKEGADVFRGVGGGTPYYMSPEQWMGRKADERSDLYTLGIILHEMVTGRRPFEAKSLAELMRMHVKAPLPSPRAVNPTLPDGLCAMVRKMAAKDPGRRYANAVAFLRDLTRVARGEEPDALAEFGRHVRCGFCETFNPADAKKCRV